MARPLRIEFEGALYHITNYGNSGKRIFLEDDDRLTFLDYLHRVVKGYHWRCYAFCLMPDHYHLLIETETPSLSNGMKYLNGSYTQFFNRKYQVPGHVFQGRFRAILVEPDRYLLELSRYIVLNPVRSGLVRSAKDWPWSSYRATAGQSEPIEALSLEPIYAAFGGDLEKAMRAYRNYVSEGRNQESPWNRLKNQIYLGSDEFIRSVQRNIKQEQSLKDIPKSQLLGPEKPLSYYAKQYRKRNQAMAEAYRSGHFTLGQIGNFFGVSYATVSRAVKEIGL